MDYLQLLNEHIEQTIKDAGGVDRLGLRKMNRILPLLILFLQEDNSNQTIVNKALAGDMDSFEVLANKFNASQEEKKIFREYIKFCILDEARRNKEGNQGQKPGVNEKSQYPIDSPHLWFSMNIEVINRMLKYLSYASPLCVTINHYLCGADNGQEPDGNLFFQAGVLQLRHDNETFQLIVPIIYGYFSKKGSRTEFRGKHLVVSYKEHKIFISAKINNIEEKIETNVCVRGSKSDCMSVTSDIGITDEMFADLLKCVPEAIVHKEFNFPQYHIVPVDFSIINIIPLWNSLDVIGFKVHFGPPENGLNLNDKVECQANTITMRKGPVLYTYMRAEVIKALEDVNLFKGDDKKIIVDDYKGVTIREHIKIHASGYTQEFHEFHTILNDGDEAIEVYAKGKVIGFVDINFALRATVYYNLIYKNKRTTAQIKMQRRKDYWPWSSGGNICVSNEAEDSAREICKKLEGKLDQIDISWPYPFVINLDKIDFYRNDGCIVIKYNLDI